MSKVNVSQTLEYLKAVLLHDRDNEIMQADECLSQYITDHNDRDAYREKDRQVKQLARAWDKMINELGKWEAKAKSIEAACENFYGN